MLFANASRAPPRRSLALRRIATKWPSPSREPTRIERDCQQMVQWARQFIDAGTFAAQSGARDLRRTACGTSSRLSAIISRHPARLPTTRRSGAFCGGFSFFRSISKPGLGLRSPRARTGPFGARAGRSGRAADLWSVLSDEALACDAAGGAVDRPTLVQELEQTHKFRLGQRPDIRPVYARLSASGGRCAGRHSRQIGGARLSRAD